MTDANGCPNCGAERPSGGLGGLCPRCLLEHALELGLPDRAGASVLAALAATVGSIPQVLLRDDTATGAPPAPVVRPSAALMPDLPDRSARLQLFGEIARGGMGAVLRGRDVDLGRDLAVKVLLEAHHEKPELVRRFVEEAQIGGQLQHPGIVPVYELGSFADHRPFFTMKLIKGHTLAELLKERKGPGEDRPRFLAIFSQVCQTMAYTHARGVIHRDLKPSNIMVGSFGEVQVMDWGLAKVLPRGADAADVAEGGRERAQQTFIATARIDSDTERSQAGSVMGTPAYMAPEQARGEINLVDERADVFALGSILCEVLTGEAAFTGRSAGEVHRKAALGDLADAHARLDSSGAGPELIALAGNAMAREREDRPRDAGGLAERVTTYLGSLELRLRQAELDRAAESARAEEARARATVERSRRRRTVALAAALLLLAGLGGGGYAYHRSEARERSANMALAVRELEVLYGQARKSGDDAQKWADAHAAAEAAGRLMADLDDPKERRLAEDLIRAVQDGALSAAKDRELAATLIDIRSSSSDDRDGSATDSAYRAAFQGANIDPNVLRPAELAARVRPRPDAVVATIASALDEWAAARRAMRKDGAGTAPLVAAARAIDPDEWRGRLREALDLADKPARRAALLRLADSLGDRHLPAVSAALLGKALRDLGERARAESVLRAGSREHPRDVWVNYGLARTLEALGRRDDAIRFYMAARAIGPETAHELAHALEQSGQGEEAVAVFRDLVGLKPENGRHLLCLGRSLHSQGRAADEAAVLARAEAALRKRVAVRPNDSEAHMNLGGALRAQGKRDAAIGEYRAAIGIDPEDADAHLNLGTELQERGQLVEAIAEHREAIRLRPDDSNAHNSLANDLYSQGALDEAIAEYREAIRLRADDVFAHYNLGNALRSQGKPAEAIAEYREVIRLQPDLAEAHCNVAAELQGQGRFQEALAEYRKGHELGSRRADWLQPSAEWVRQAERMAALEGRLPAVLRGGDRPRDAAEGLVFANLAYRTKRCGSSVRLYALAFGADPKLAEDMSGGHRYNAACAAALAGDGKGEDQPPPDEAERARLRTQAVAWLRADLAAWTNQAASGPHQAKDLAAQTLEHWKTDADLVGLRDEAAVKALPEDERSACHALWAQVDAVLKKSLAR